MLTAVSVWHASSIARMAAVRVTCCAGVQDDVGEHMNVYGNMTCSWFAVCGWGGCEYGYGCGGAYVCCCSWGYVLCAYGGAYLAGSIGGGGYCVSAGCGIVANVLDPLVAGVLCWYVFLVCRATARSVTLVMVFKAVSSWRQRLTNSLKRAMFSITDDDAIW